MSLSSSMEYGPPDPIFSMRRACSSGHGEVIPQDKEGEEEEQQNDGVLILDAVVTKENKEGNSSSIDLCEKAPPLSKKSKSSSSPSKMKRSTSSSNSKKERKQDSPARERPKTGDPWPERDALSFTRSLVFYGMGAVTDENVLACQYILEARSIRQKYYEGKGTSVLLNVGNEKDYKDDRKLEYRLGKEGVMEVYIKGDEECRNLVKVPSIDDFVRDYSRLEEICSEGAMRSFCFQRLQMLSSAFKLYVTANGALENEEQRNLLGTDFYRTMKVDNHIHLAAAASANQFVSFVGDKLENESNTVVTEDGQTLRDVFDSAGLSADHLTIDAFNVLADYSSYQRFDNFNSNFSPFRMANMRQIFLKVENAIDGRYFAELTKTLFTNLEKSKSNNAATEMRLSIYGMEQDEWLKLAKWILKDWEGGKNYKGGPVLSSRNRWLVQIPRLWRIYQSKGGRRQQKQQERSFQDMLENIFSPIFEATLNPEENPEVAEVLTHIVGFDSVDDEGSPEAPCNCTRPSSWKDKQNPAYCWQLYYLWANIEILNGIRKSKGLNTFAFRPHAGETGDPMHLAATYMLSQSINHGINLDHQVSLQYLYYLDQVGLSISPLSNNFLFCKIVRNPFPKLFKRGLNVTLSTDDPLLFHMSDDALLEEYSVARASFDLSMTDVSEIARNSVLQSGFEDELKEKWLGKNFRKGVTFCDERKTHVPLTRAKFRAEHLAFEHMFINLIAAGKGDVALKDMMVQFGLARDAYRNCLMQNLPDISTFPEQNQL